MASIGTSRRGQQSRSDLEINADINVTSLVDVAFTLLVIFIITAPILQGGIEVAIPRADVRPLTAQDEPFFITVMSDGSILMEETPVTLQELEDGLPQLLAGGSVERVFIRADSLAPYGPVLRTMATALNSGVPWSLVAEPYRER
ncbi:MAG TPA: biopolymer transporter ExbD [Longimicrobiales bacterium]|nr:biopolymer transporter ExbD [Longimicrobiales bacterium]